MRLYDSDESEFTENMDEGEVMDTNDNDDEGLQEGWCEG